MKTEGLKTFIFSAAIALVGVIEMTDWADIVPNEYLGAVLAVIGVIGAVIRKNTIGPAAGASKETIAKAKETISNR